MATFNSPYQPWRSNAKHDAMVTVSGGVYCGVDVYGGINM